MKVAERLISVVEKGKDHTVVKNYRIVVEVIGAIHSTAVFDQDKQVTPLDSIHVPFFVDLSLESNGHLRGRKDLCEYLMDTVESSFRAKRAAEDEVEEPVQ